jgi:archaemetzincin
MITRPRIIYLTPLSDTAMTHLESVAESIQIQFGTEVKIMRNRGIPAYALDASRKQYNSNMILKRLLEICPPDTLKILGITDLDLFSPIFKYVFGEAQFGGKGAVISSFRLRGNPEEASGRGCPPLADRMEKEAIHELGHTFNLRHCSDPDCVMHYSVGIQCADRKFAFFCPVCRDLMLWHMAKNLFLKT